MIPSINNSSFFINVHKFNKCTSLRFCGNSNTKIYKKSEDNDSSSIQKSSDKTTDKLLAYYPIKERRLISNKPNSWEYQRICIDVPDDDYCNIDD